MNRVEAAINQGRCVLALGSEALADGTVLMEMRRRTAIPMIGLGGQVADPAVAPSAEALQPCLAVGGGLLVLVEPNAAVDGPGLYALAAAIQKAPRKPRLCIATRAFNPFTLPLTLRMLKMDQERKRARDFMASLPVPPPVAAAGASAAEPGQQKKKKKKKKAVRNERAPRVGFSGREEELAELASLLGQGGPIVVWGPHGVGKRWLVERCLADSPLRRQLDVALGEGTRTDALYARLAQLCLDGGEKRLAKALRNPENRPPPVELAELAVECLKAEDLSDTVMVIHGVDRLMRDDGSFHRRGRLQLLLEALLAGSYAPRLVFPCTLRPVFYREAAGQNLRLLRLEGLKGKDIYEIFDAYRYGDVPRGKMGEIGQHLHGHPLATRSFAIAARDAKEREKQLGDRRSFKMRDLGDTDTLSRRLRRAIDKLPDSARSALATIAHLRYPAEAAFLQRLGITRQDRLLLMALGLLDFTPGEPDRLYYVHWLVQKQLSRRETNDIGTFDKLGEQTVELFKHASGSEWLRLGQEINRYAIGARKPRERLRVGYPDNDAQVESVHGLMRGHRPFLELAETRINAVLKNDPANTEALLLRAAHLDASKAPADRIEKAYAQAAKLAPTPEVFHQEANWYQWRAKRTDDEAAIDALQRGVQLFPQNGRLRRRLAGLLLQARKVDEAIAVTREAMDLEPMMADSYGLLGEILTDRGPAAWEEASQHLEEALRLAPEDPVHLARAGRLLHLRGLLDRQQREALWEQAREHLEKAVKAPRRNTSALVELATQLLDRPDSCDTERVAWLLKQAAKQRNAPDLKILNARLAARRGRVEEAEAVLARLVQHDPKNHYARAALAEVLYSKSRIFQAHATYQLAQADAPPDAAERYAYEAKMELLQALIESGQAIEIERQADVEAAERAQQRPPPAEAPRPTVVHRRPGREPDESAE